MLPYDPELIRVSLAFPLAEALTFLIAIIYFLKIKPSALIKDGQP